MLFFIYIHVIEVCPEVDATYFLKDVHQCLGIPPIPVHACVISISSYNGDLEHTEGWADRHTWVGSILRFTIQILRVNKS